MQPTKLVRRKIIELLLARWFHRVVPKNDQIEMYIAAVRFERAVYGALAAMHYFWGTVINKPSTAESFFLIERVSNVRSLLLTDKILQTARAAITMNVMSLDDAHALVALYDDAIGKGKIIDRDDGLSRLKSAFLSS
jgi:penicillin-binding protein 1A